MRTHKLFLLSVAITIALGSSAAFGPGPSYREETDDALERLQAHGHHLAQRPPDAGRCSAGLPRSGAGTISPMRFRFSRSMATALRP